MENASSIPLISLTFCLILKKPEKKHVITQKNFLKNPRRSFLCKSHKFSKAFFLASLFFPKENEPHLLSWNMTGQVEITKTFCDNYCESLKHLKQTINICGKSAHLALCNCWRTIQHCLAIIFVTVRPPNSFCFCISFIQLFKELSDVLNMT